MKKSVQIRAVLAVAAALACGVGAVADAADIRSWDQKIDDATKRYVVLAAFNNQAVLDKETQLVWQRQASGGVNWAGAIYACIRATTGGRQGWRLPSFSELSSLVGSANSIANGHPFTGFPSKGAFWSITTGSEDFRAWSRQLTNLDPSYIFGSYKSSTSYYLCVRGPGADSGQ